MAFFLSLLVLKREQSIFVNCYAFVRGCQMLRTIPKRTIGQNSRKYQSKRQHHNNHNRRSKP